MKKLIFLIVGLLIAFSISTSAQTKQYKMGYKVQEALTSATTISVTPANTLTLYTLVADTSVTFNAVTTYAVPADMVVFRIKANTSQRIITWGTNLDGLTDTITSGKTWIISFIWDGTAFKKLSTVTTD